jgi:ABC-type transport system substrate-binding protein
MGKYCFFAKRKGLLILPAIVLVCASILAGCSGNATPAASTPVTSTSAVAQAATTPAVTAPATSAVIPSTTRPSGTTPAATPTPLSTVTSKYGGTLRYDWGTGPGNPIGVPWEGSGAAVFQMQQAIEYPLREQLDGSFTPTLAESYDVNVGPANPSITFHLRKGVKFHDGTDFNAQVFKWNLDQEMGPTSVNLPSTSNWKSIEVVDDYTVRVNLKTWQNTQLVTFANNVAAMVSPAAFQKNGLAWMEWNMVGTGPFIQTNFQRDVSLTFTKNPNYWAAGKPYLDGIQIQYVIDMMTSEALMKSGGSEVLNCQGDGRVANDLVAAGFKILTQPIGTGALANLTPDSINPSSPWSNVQVRMAAEYAIDKEALAKTFGLGYAIPVYQICGPDSPGYDPSLTGRKYDVAKAKQLLTEAGYPDGFKTTIIAAPFGLNTDMVVAIQAYLAKVGIKCDLQFPAAAQAMQFITNPPPVNTLIINPYMLYANANRIFSFYFNEPSPGANKGLKHPPGWADLLAATLATPQVDPVLAKKCEDAIYNDCTFIPLTTSLGLTAATNNVQDSGIGSRGSSTYWNPDNVWLSK